MDHNYGLHYQFHRGRAVELSDTDLESAIDVARRRMRRDALRDEPANVAHAAVELAALKDEHIDRYCLALRELRASAGIIAGMNQPRA